MKILVTGGKSSQSYKILNAFTDNDVILADYGEIPKILFANRQLVSLGNRNDEVIAHNLLTACLNHHVDTLLPLHDFEISAVSKSMILFFEFGIEVLLPEISELPKYFYNRKDIQIGINWAVFIKGELFFTLKPNEFMVSLGRSKSLNGVFYLSENTYDLTAVLFTIK